MIRIILSILLLFLVDASLQDQQCWCENEISMAASASYRMHSMIGEKFVRESACTSENKCYEVSDAVVIVGCSPRAFRYYSIDGTVQSVTALVTPENLNSPKVNTTSWEVDRLYIQHSSYYIHMFEAMFWSGAVEKGSSAEVLALGLGAANMHNYYKERYPELNVTTVEADVIVKEMAERWFGLREADYGTVEIADVKSYLEHRVFGDGKRKDVILIDVSYHDVDREIVAPLEEFTKEDSIELLSECIHHKGVVIVNILAGTQSSKGKATLQLSTFYNEFFEFVDVLETKENNSVLVCRHVPIVTPHSFDSPKYKPLDG